VLADHAGKVGAVVGHVDPRLTFETERGLEASGTLDTSTELGRRVYALVKSGALSWSIGYVVPRGGSRRTGKLTELTEIDFAEISAVPVPANEGARTLSIKSARPVQLVTFDVA
jgi:HK97 family phage prohead protease